MLWLLRHADAAPGSPDDKRPLTERGIEQARAAGLALKQLDVHLDACLSSPKLRALQTAALACEPFDVRELTAGLGEVLLVGHDPSFSLTVHALTGAQARLRKGGLAAIEKGELLLLLRPRELALIASAQERVG